MGFVAWCLLVAGGFHNAPEVVFVAIPVPHPADGLVAVSALVSTEGYEFVGIDVTTSVGSAGAIWNDIPGPRPGPRGPNGEFLPPRPAPPDPEE